MSRLLPFDVKSVQKGQRNTFNATFQYGAVIDLVPPNGLPHYATFAIRIIGFGFRQCNLRTTVSKHS
jgi:hypothetical protein